MPQQLEDAPECPPLMRHVWEWFLELDAEREIGMEGPQRIRYRDIDEWAASLQIHVEVFEKRAIRRLDTAHLAHLAKRKG